MRVYYVYVMASRSRVLYTGVSNDLARRVNEHKQGLTPGFTSRYRITRLVYFEEFADVRDAIAREKQIKAWTRARLRLCGELVQQPGELLTRKPASAHHHARDASSAGDVIERVAVDQQQICFLPRADCALIAALPQKFRRVRRCRPQRLEWLDASRDEIRHHPMIR